MINKNTFLTAFLAVLTFFGGVQISSAQDVPREEFSGNLIDFNGTRTQTAFFTLRLKGRTNDADSKEFLGVLADQGQFKLLDTISDTDLGSFSIDRNIGRRLNLVRETNVDGKRRIFIVFERWMQTAERLNAGNSIEYPFSVIDITIDSQTGRGEGSYIAAARIKFDEDGDDDGIPQVEIENFFTYKSKLVSIVNETKNNRNS